MTSNQIAYATAVEGVTHNRNTEEEANRHNTVTEELTQQQIDLDALRLEYENNWKIRDQQLTEQYNDLYAQYQQANIDAKVQLETAMQDIIRTKNDAEALYHQQLASIQEQQNAISNKVYEESAAHNRVTEYLTNEQIAANKYISEQKLKFEKYQFDTESSIKTLQTQINLLSANQNYLLGERKFLVDSTNALINQERVEVEKTRNNQNLFMGLFNGGVNLIRAIGGR